MFKLRVASIVKAFRGLPDGAKNPRPACLPKVIVLSRAKLIVYCFIAGMIAGTVQALLGHGRLAAVLQPAMAVMRARTIVIDPGHGGPDPGAVGVTGVLEKDIVLDIGLHLKDLLKKSGAIPVMTRETDDVLSNSMVIGEHSKKDDLYARAEMGNAPGVDAFVSIHANRFPSPRWYGAQTFYYPHGHPDSRRLAETIQAELIRITKNTEREALPKTDQYVLKASKVPACTVEVGFLSNPAEEALLSQKAYRQEVAWAIMLGIAKFFQESEKPVSREP